jgi:S-adenosylmethionine:tRNA ribosyltransferase-isomerase
MSALEAAELLEATEPPELRGWGRDDVSLLVAHRRSGSLTHHSFRELPQILRPGDLLVVNTSATLPAALPATLEGRPLDLHLSTRLEGETWVVELRGKDAAPLRPPSTGSRLELPAGAHAEIVAPYAGGGRLVAARLELGAPVKEYLDRHGRPIRYSYARTGLPLAAYQTVFALHPGSAEMPSAARPFTTELVTELVAGGVLFAPIALHTGVSSPELGEPPYPERFAVSETTARLVNAVRWWGGRVIAVGTTAVRALETTAGPDGTVSSGAGWTSLTVTPERGVRAIDGLLTGWHEPRSSHRQLLEAVAGPNLLERSYREADAHGYSCHEFGDLHLIID